MKINNAVSLIVNFYNKQFCTKITISLPNKQLWAKK